ncbi:ArsC/Spx/MgsR family protein [Flavobacterium sp.]|uniref:ArsC/Spx/MgsR family protein n=1 Tax=Flavobacterium sp. TaxID=239 RepID=UPI0025F1F060|nr:ArsC/Spx/MgsR family protein [Flavobacterium sp.]
MLQILHNPRCGKSRDCLAFATESQLEFEIINYLENPLSVAELKVLLKKLKIKPIEIVRQKEPIWIEKYKDKSLTNTQIINALSKYPILIQRPIIIDVDNAIIARDKDKLDDLFR